MVIILRIMLRTMYRKKTKLLDKEKQYLFIVFKIIILNYLRVRRFPFPRLHNLLNFIF